VISPLQSQASNITPILNLSNSTNGTLKTYEKCYRDLKISRQLGIGVFGIVYQGQKKDRSLIAIKQLLIDGEITADYLLQVSNTSQTLVGLQHPNLVSFYGMTVAGPLCLVSEYIEGASLVELIKTNTPLTPKIISQIVFGVAKAMAHLHKNNVVHGILASRNILVDNNGNPKLTDFGLMSILPKDNLMTSDLAPIRWYAPEYIANINKTYEKTSDVWCFGVVLWEIVERKEPFAGMDPLQVVSKVTTEKLRLHIPEHCEPTVLSELMFKCWKEDPAQRVTFQDICQLCTSRL